jgi:hypothetical protein
LRGSRKSTLVNEMGAKSTIFQALSHAREASGSVVARPLGGGLAAGIGCDGAGVIARVLARVLG